MTTIRSFLAAVLLLISAAMPTTSSAQFADQMTWGGTGGGSANAQTVTIQNVSGLADLLGVSIRFSPGATNTGATTLAVGGTAATAARKWSPSGLIALTGGELRTGVPVLVMYNGTFWVLLTPTVTQPLETWQFLTSGTTYNTGTVGGQLARQIIVRFCGGGGGGSAAFTNLGSAGTATVFNSVEAAPGGGGLADGGGLGGTGGAGAATQRVPGNSGGSGFNNISSLSASGFGGAGMDGGGTRGVAGPTAGMSAAANTCAGGSGGSGASGSDSSAGAGGGAGETVLLIITNPAASYTYSIGIGGAGGAAGVSAGGTGGSGKITVRELYLSPANDNFFLEGECACAA